MSGTDGAWVPSSTTEDDIAGDASSEAGTKAPLRLRARYAMPSTNLAYDAGRIKFKTTGTWILRGRCLV
eukprot:18312-Rhodomonas_salina.1